MSARARITEAARQAAEWAMFAGLVLIGAIMFVPLWLLSKVTRKEKGDDPETGEKP